MGYRLDCTCIENVRQIKLTSQMILTKCFFFTPICTGGNGMPTLAGAIVGDVTVSNVCR